MKLKMKILLFSSLFTLILIVLINTAIYYMFYKVSADSELDQLVNDTQAMIETMNDNPDIPEEELLKAFLPNEGMIRIIGKDSKPIIPTLTKKKELWKLESVYSKSEERTINKTLANGPVAVISKPIIWENGDIVTLQVSEHLVVLQQNMKILFYVLLIASIVMLVPTYIGANLLSRFLLKPIKSLTQAMKENVGHDEWKKIDVLNKSKDELYDMEKTFNEMIDHLEDNFRKQEIFVSDASHELKTPISIVKSYAQLLSRRGVNDPELVSESIDAIESEADRMQKLVEQMLNLAKNQVNMKTEAVNFTSICLEAVRTFKGSTNRDIYFSQEDIHLPVKGNKSQLQQIVYILIDNALKYSKDPIEIGLTQQEKWVVFTVIDYGQGIPKVEQDRIFNRFYRVDKARSRETGGSGLGLPIAKAIAESHHGKLEVTSQVGKGSTFTFKIPLLSEE